MSSDFTDLHSEKGFQSGLDILFPPEEEGWWYGDLTAWNFASTFREIVKIVPKTMAKKSFKQLKWTIDTSGEIEPVEWNETNLTFFSDHFIDFLQDTGESLTIPQFPESIYNSSRH
jgi:hypothetical protein